MEVCDNENAQVTTKEYSEPCENVHDAVCTNEKTPNNAKSESSTVSMDVENAFESRTESSIEDGVKCNNLPEITSNQESDTNKQDLTDSRTKNAPKIRTKESVDGYQIRNKNKDTQMSNALSQLMVYGGMSDSEDSAADSEESSTDSETDSESSDAICHTKSSTEISSSVLVNSDFRDNDSSSSSSEYVSDSCSDSEIGAWGITLVPETKQPVDHPKVLRTKGEFSLDDLPPIEDLKISVPEQQCLEIGVVTSVIEQLVIVQSLPGTPAYDIDTLLFLNRGQQPLGRIFDVLGPVIEPYYAIRFNSYEQAIETGVKPGTPVYCAPNTQHTAYVFVSELMKVKGSDASWEHNNEPPERYLDYSDDEEERKAKRVQQVKNESTSKTRKYNSLERNKKFEQQMNNKNLLMNEHFKNQPSTSQRPNYSSFMPSPPGWGAPVQFPLGVPNVPQNVSPFRPFQGFPNYSMPDPHQPFVAMRPGLYVPPPSMFNPNVPPPPLIRPQPMQYFAAPRPWAPPSNSPVKPPNGNFGSRC